MVIIYFMMGANAHSSVLGDIDNDGKIGISEAIYALQSVSGIRTVQSCDDKIIFSKMVNIDNPLYGESALTVPSGKVFILTDIYASPSYYDYPNRTSNWYEVLILGSEIAFDHQYDGLMETHLTSGIVFGPGVSLFLFVTNFKSFVTISGYYTSSIPYEPLP